MSPIRVTARRALGSLFSRRSSAFSFAAFLAASAAAFAHALAAAEGSAVSVAAVWASAAAPILPVLAALLAMDAWSGELRSGGIDMLLSAPVRERELVAGKFLGTWAATSAAAILSLVSCAACTWKLAPGAFAGTEAIDFACAAFAVCLQSALWCAVSLAASATTKSAAAAALASVAATVALPRFAWIALAALSGRGRTAFGDMPFDAHAADFASGSVSSGVAIAYLCATWAFLFANSKTIASYRLCGRGSAKARSAAALSAVLAFVFAAMLAFLAIRLDAMADFSSGGAAPFSARTRALLAENVGGLRAVCFMPRDSRRRRDAGRILRRLKREAEAAGGRATVEYVDPTWDLGPASRLVRRGVKSGSIVFESGRRMAVLPPEEPVGERECASAIRRLSVPASGRSVCWTSGHGERSFSDYGAFGMSDAARELSRDGFANVSIDLSAAPVPDGCAFVAVCGPRQDFSRAELGRLDSYLRGGGRLLALVGTPLDGLSSTLAAWGIRTGPAAQPGVATVTGSDVAADALPDHPVSAGIGGGRVVLERPLSFTASSAAGGAGADGIRFSPLCGAEGVAFAAAAERGAGAGADLAVRPTRIVAVGDSTFAMNGAIASRANANRDFFLNCAAFLSGSADAAPGGADPDAVSLGMDRAARRVHLAACAGAFPLFALVALLAVAARRSAK